MRDESHELAEFAVPRGRPAQVHPRGGGRGRRARAARLGARPPTQSLANSKTIAFAQPDTTFASVYPLLLKGAKQEAIKRGYQVLQSHANQQLDAQVQEIEHMDRPKASAA